MKSFDEAKGLAPLVGFTDDFQLWLAAEDQADALAHDGMVVNDEQADLGIHAETSGIGCGIVSLTLVPVPGFDRISKLPPNNEARSRMPRRPSGVESLAG